MLPDDEDPQSVLVPVIAFQEMKSVPRVNSPLFCDDVGSRAAAAETLGVNTKKTVVYAEDTEIRVSHWKGG
jgi:hypothetical protein